MYEPSKPSLVLNVTELVVSDTLKISWQTQNDGTISYDFNLIN
jgi:hypothetical protein